MVGGTKSAEETSQMPSRTVGTRVLELVSRIALLIVPTVCVVALLFFVLPRNPESYFLGFALKNSLLQTSRSPKLVLVGGSNLAFGTDSRMLSEAFGVSVVNSSLHAGLGAEFMLDSVEKHINAGDTVIIALEYNVCLEKGLLAGDDALYEFLFEDPKFVINCRKKRYADVLLGLGRAAGQRLASCIFGECFKKDVIYNANAFDEYGDVVSHLDKRSHDMQPTAGVWGDVQMDPGLLMCIRAFITHVEGRGARVYILPPCYRDKDYLVNARQIESMYLEIQRAFPMSALSRPQEFVFNSSEHFFDSRYHLNRQGREIRTARIVEYLRYASIRDGWAFNQRTLRR